MSLAHVIAVMTTVFVGARVHHVAHMRPGPLERAAEVARALELAAGATGVPLELLTALAWSESRFDNNLVGKVGEVSFMQLHPQGRGRAYPPPCRASRKTPDAYCLSKAAYLGAVALRQGYEECGTWGMAIGAYKSGRCQEGPRSRAVLTLWAWLELAAEQL